MLLTSNVAAFTQSLANCQVSWDGQCLDLDLGNLQRRWQLLPGGLRCTSLQSDTYEWLDPQAPASINFDIPGITSPDLLLTAITCDLDDDDQFSSSHLRLNIHYEFTGGKLIQEIWAWHNIGMRMVFHIQATAASTSSSVAALDRLSLAHAPQQSLCWGYYNDTQNRNRPETPLLEQSIEHGDSWHNNWASACALQHGSHALIIVKESHKCVNQAGIDGGSFDLQNNLFTVDGWGLLPHDVEEAALKTSWATWYISSAADQPSIARACKKFDIHRYPSLQQHDAIIMSNTWGSGFCGDPKPGAIGNPSRRCAHEPVVLSEIESCGDLGINFLQIDDGWQTSNDEHWDPRENGWHPHPQCWPRGWHSAVRAAKDHNVTLGLWAPAEEISYTELISNARSGGFKQFKLDFANFRHHDQLATVMKRCRTFIKDMDHQCRVNWDATENHARTGYYYGRDLGSVYLANRKPDYPEVTIYEPWLMLRDAWQIAQYLPLKQFQISIQNPTHTDRRTEAHKHSISYCTAIGCSGIPLFFHRTSLYTEEQRTDVRNFLNVYAQHHQLLLNAECIPVGEEPSNASWTGFDYQIDEMNGYLLVFRELHDQRPDYGLTLERLAGKTVTLSDCHQDHIWSKTVNDHGFLDVHIEKPASAQLIHYQIQ